MGERTPLALVDSPAAAHAGGDRGHHQYRQRTDRPLADVRLVRQLDGCLRRARRGRSPVSHAVKAVGMELCPALGIAIPVGKDSLSMNTDWTRRCQPRHRARTGVPDRFRVCPGHRRPPTVTRAATAHCSQQAPVDRPWPWPRPPGRVVPGTGPRRIRCEPPDLDNAADAGGLFCGAIQELRAAGQILAYHDRSDGGLIVTFAKWRSRRVAGCACQSAGHAGDAHWLAHVCLPKSRVQSSRWPLRPASRAGVSCSTWPGRAGCA